MELLCDGPLEGEEFLFVGMIPLFGVIHNPTRISDRMVASISLLLRKNSPRPLPDASVSRRNGLSKSGKARMGA